MLTHDDIREIALSMPGAYEHASYGGRPSFRTRPRSFCWIRDEPEALVVWVDSLEEKDVLLAEDPEVFFTIPHYDGYAAVLIDLEQADRAVAREMITDSYRLRAPKRLLAQLDAGLEADSDTAGD